jgi:phosphatidylserine/phosphatidylglycerophosphate/cardiolipin synthase-like enzyme
MVIDGAVTLTGSMNWTRGAAANSEDLNLVSSPVVAVADALDYLMTLATLRILDALAGPEPETPADHQREWDRERTERALPVIEP